jgi:hypothetical protein
MVAGCMDHFVKRAKRQPHVQVSPSCDMDDAGDPKGPRYARATELQAGYLAVRRKARENAAAQAFAELGRLLDSER